MQAKNFSAYTWSCLQQLGVIEVDKNNMHEARILRPLTEKEESELPLSILLSIQEIMLLKGGLQKTYHLRSIQRSAVNLSGDFLFSSLRDNGNLCGVMFDFTGHGVGPSMLALPPGRLFNVLVKQGCALESIAAGINKLIFKITETGYFAAGCFFEINRQEQSIKIINHGLPKQLVFRYSGAITTNTTTNIPLGILKEVSGLVVNKLEFNRGDALLFFTDGLTEQINEFSELFGEERVVASLQQQPEDLALTGVKLADWRLMNLKKNFDEFRNAEQQRDDLTIAQVYLNV